jgi:predicted outer membrane protein
MFGFGSPLRNLVAALELSLLLISTCSAAEQQPRSAPDTAKPAPERKTDFRADGRGVTVTANKPVDPQAHAQTKEGMIATCLAISNGEEVALGKLAISKADNAKVRDFAEKMVKDHSDMLAKLERLGGHSGVLEGQAHAAHTGDRPQLTSSQGGSSAMGFDFVNMKRQIAQQCLQSAEKMWQEKKAPDAEMCYVGQQLVMHQQMIDAATVLRQHASGELKDAIDEGIETAKSHKKHAEHLIEELAHESKSK